jgi:predicted membrane-bound spermidine synthase
MGHTTIDASEPIASDVPERNTTPKNLDSSRSPAPIASGPRLLVSFRYLISLAFLGALFLPPLAYFSSPASGGVVSSSGDALPWLLGYVVLACAAMFAFYGGLRRLEPRLKELAQQQILFLEGLGERSLTAAIAGSAALSLFLELAMIRWQGTIFEFFAFYKNYGLLACFAGLGLGYALSRSKHGIPLVLTIPLLVGQFALLIGLRYGMPNRPYSLEAIPFREQLNMGWTATLDQVGVIYLLLSVVFLLTSLAFIPIGQLCGKLMERRPQLSSYGLNLLGSVVGVVLMFLVSFLWTPPVVWFALSFLAMLYFLVRKPLSLLSGIGLAVAGLIILAWPVNPLWNKIYSPYQQLEIGYGKDGLMVIRAAGQYYQRVRNLRVPAVGSSEDHDLTLVRNYYDLPFKIQPGQNDIAIVGAGSGNDVAAGLRAGARHIDAIEIDPAILGAGMANHPERPYDDPRVRPIVNDARSFFRTTGDRFDLIVYGLLDSHTLLSHASSVRLDSFVYTVEGLREARSRLKENGVLSLSFAVLNDNMGKKIYEMMKQAFDGKEPICILSHAEGARTFVQSRNGDLVIPPAVFEQANASDKTAFYRDSDSKADVSTDDWPFLYMPQRVYPVSYLVVLGLILLLSFVLYGSFFRESLEVTHVPFFFLGAGFMLIETKAITELGLTFGNTWHVIAIAIASILAMAYLANSAVRRLQIVSSAWSYCFLFASLIFGWWLSRSGGLPSTVAGRIGTAILLTCPLFFSGVIFSSLLRAQENISRVMSVNILGAMCGGLLEYNSMYFGFRFLYLLALGLYAGALLSSFVARLPSRSARTV